MSDAGEPVYADSVEPPDGHAHVEDSMMDLGVKDLVRTASVNNETIPRGRLRNTIGSARWTESAASQLGLTEPAAQNRHSRHHHNCAPKLSFQRTREPGALCPQRGRPQATDFPAHPERAATAEVAR